MRRSGVGMLCVLVLVRGDEGVEKGLEVGCVLR
jgi:hypothetical protein